MKNVLFLLLVVLLASCYKPIEHTEYPHQIGDTIYWRPFMEDTVCVRYEYSIAVNGDTINTIENTVIRTCGSFGFGNCKRADGSVYLYTRTVCPPCRAYWIILGTNEIIIR